MPGLLQWDRLPFPHRNQPRAKFWSTPAVSRGLGALQGALFLALMYGILLSLALEMIMQPSRCPSDEA